MTALETCPDIFYKRLLHKRFFVLSIVVVLALTATTLTTGGHATKDGSQKALSVGLKSLPDINPVRNPPHTVGEICTINIGITMDRSGGIYSDRDELKFHVKGLLDLLHERTKSNPDSRANVIINAFSTYDVAQNGINPNSPITRDQWLDSINIANDDSYALQNQNVDDIWFARNSLTPPSDDSRPETAYKGYFSGKYADGTEFRPHRKASMIGTNYHAAFTQFAKQISDFTDGRASVSGDEDFDLVLMLTDGLPNSHYGENHQADYGEPSLSWKFNDEENFKYVTDSINNLRLGRAFKNSDGEPMVEPSFGARPPVAVKGIILGEVLTDETKREQAIATMNKLFGPQDSTWFAAPTYSVLDEAIEDAVSDVTCDSDEMAEVVPEIELSSSYASPVEENSGVDVELTIKNKSNVSVSNLQWGVQQELSVEPVWTALAGVTLGPAGSPTDSRTVTFSFNSGWESEFQYYFTAFGIANIDPVTQYCARPEMKGTAAAAAKDPTHGTGPDYEDPCGTFGFADAKITVRPRAYPS